MIHSLDFKTLAFALRIARRLIASGKGPEGLALLRELLAGMANSNQIPGVIEAWTATGFRFAPSASIIGLGKRLPAIVKTFADSGYAAEAVRVMATGVALDPTLGGQLVEAAGNAFARTRPETRSEFSIDAARQLVSVGSGILEAGNPEGIVLMGAAHRVARGVEMPIEEIVVSLEGLPNRQPASLELAEAQELTKAAYDLHFSGRQDPAVRVGALVPAMVSAPAAEHLFDRLHSAVRPGTENVFEASRRILAKGYAATAANLLVDSGTVSADDVWTSLHEEIRDPGTELKAPGKASYTARSTLSRVVRRAGVEPPGPSFFFALKGDGTRCNEALWGQAFDLLFHYDILPTDALAGVDGEKLKQFVQSNAKAVFSVSVIPKGLILLEGGGGRVVTFENGKMVGEVPRFRLQAPELDDAEPEPRGFYAVFTILGAVIYSAFLEIKLVAKLAEGPCSPQILDLDLSEIAKIKIDEPRIAEIYTTSEDGGSAWRISGKVNGVHLKSDTTKLLGSTNLDKEYATAGILGDLKVVAGATVWRLIEKQLDLPADQEDAALVCMRTTLMAGSKLYKRFADDPTFKQVLDAIEELPDGSKITFITDGTVFPWELFYPLSYNVADSEKNYQPDKLWGRRFLFETLLIVHSESEKPPVLRQQSGNLYVSMGIDGVIDTEAPWVDRPPPLPVAVQKDYFETELKGRAAYFEEYDKILDTIVKKPDPASLIYFFCHGTADMLQFELAKRKLTPDIVDNDYAAYPGWPIVFVNACDAGDISPLSFFSFRKAFRKRKAAGLIAPSFPIPTLFAAMFANAFFRAYADHRPVGRILFDLRRELLAKNNPLGLWYSLQCPLDVQAPKH